MALLKTVLFLLLGTLTAANHLPLAKQISIPETTSTAAYQDPQEDFRLPKNTVPTHYAIHLKTTVHEADTDFQGIVNIHLDVKEPTNKITVHNRDLNIDSATLYGVGDEGTYELATSYNNQTEQLSFQASSTLPIGSYILTITYNGSLQRYGSLGFLRKSYRTEDNDRRYLAATHFEPTGARTAFPCYDEPTLRTTFSLSITHHSSYNAVSNMPQLGSEVDPNDPNFQTTSFMTTLKMPTYLLAFVVSDFETRSLGQQLIHAKPNSMKETEFALNSGVLILDKLSEYTGISYYDYQPKMAQIAIPEWSSGAMENWGLVTYREAGLLFNGDLNTYRVKIGIITTIAHEYTHQWFGDLVATDWSYLWMKEGFATLYGYYGAQLAYPNEQFMDLFQVQSLQPALAQDSRATTRPMNWYANTPSEISRLFDVVAYGKGTYNAVKWGSHFLNHLFFQQPVVF